MAAITSSLSSSYLFLHLLRPPPTSPLSLSSLIRHTSRATTLRHAPPLPRLFSRNVSPSLASLHPLHSLSNSLELGIESLNREPDDKEGLGAEIGKEKVIVELPKRAPVQFEIETESRELGDELEAEDEDEGSLERGVKEDNVAKLPKRVWGKLPNLTMKEKKEIASYAHSLGKKLKAQSVGKWGVTEAVGVAMVESLEKNELLKIKIHNNCPGELDDAVKQLEELTGSVVVGQIGRTVILYRPSMAKLKAEEEKKKQAQRNQWRRQKAFKPTENREFVVKEFGRGRRGRSRFSSPS